MSSVEIAEELRRSLPGTDEILIQYLSGYLVDDAAEDEDVIEIAKTFLVSIAGKERQSTVDLLLARIQEMLSDQLSAREHRRNQPKLTKLDKVLDMSKTTMLSTLSLGEAGVDLESINKGKASRVDVKKLEKQEAKLKAKIEKRSRRDLYEGSKLLDQHRKQQTYEEMFMKINPLDASSSSKQKSKDIILPSIDVNFGSNRILSGASLTLAHGRRYGIIGRNGVGKSTLLRHIAMREVPIPHHITILFVEQEIVGDETAAIESVLKADVWRDHLLKEEIALNAQLSELDKEGDDKRFVDAREEAETRLAEVHISLSDMGAASAPARAAALLAGLGFDEEAQKRPTKSFSGGWRMRLALARALFVKPTLLLLDEPSNHSIATLHGSKTTYNPGPELLSWCRMIERFWMQLRQTLFINTQPVWITTREISLPSTRQRWKETLTYAKNTKASYFIGKICKPSLIDGVTMLIAPLKPKAGLKYLRNYLP